MSLRIFLSQSAVDAWVSSERVVLDGETLTLAPGLPPLQLVAATRFLSVSAGEDQNHLIGKVKDERELHAMGAESMMTSVVLGETAYDVEPGFLAMPLTGDASLDPTVLASLRTSLRTLASSFDA